MSAFLKDIRNAYPKAEILLMFNPHKKDFSGIYKELAASMDKVTYVQLDTLTAEQKALGHPNIAGHKVWAKTVQAGIQKVTGGK